MESAELIAILREVRDRVRSRHPQGVSPGVSAIPLADLMPLVHARDAALGKVAAIGTVNPRPGGPVNALVQAWKRFLARVLDWHVREQVEFNRKIALRASMPPSKRWAKPIAPLRLAARGRSRPRTQGHAQSLDRLAARNGSASWSRTKSSSCAVWPICRARSQHRATLMDAGYRDQVRAQHQDFTAALERQMIEVQQRLWADMERIRLEYERLIYSELRTIRQRAEVRGKPAEAPQVSVSPEVPASLPFDYGRFAERFRGAEEYVKAGQQFYLPYFTACRNVLDIGCGRGEFLEMMREAGVPARGIDLSEESVAICRHKGLDAETADLFAYLAALPEASLDGIFCSQVVEHLPPDAPAGDAAPVRQPPGAQRHHRHRDAEPGVPGHLRHALLSRSYAPASRSAPAAGLLSGGIRRGKPRSAASDARGGIDAVAGIPAGRVPGGVLWRSGLRHPGPETVSLPLFDGHRKRHFLPAAHHRHRVRPLAVCCPQHTGDVAGCRNMRVVDLDDHVARLDPGAVGG